MQKRHGLCKNMRGNKKGQVPGTSKKKEKKSEMRGKNGQVSKVELGVQDAHLSEKNEQVSDSRIRGIYYPPEKKREIAHALPKQRSKKRRGSNMRSNEN